MFLYESYQSPSFSLQSLSLSRRTGQVHCSRNHFKRLGEIVGAPLAIVLVEQIDQLKQGGLREGVRNRTAPRFGGRHRRE